MTNLELWTPELSGQADKQGWNLFECSGSVGGDLQLQRDDEMGVFESDEQAWKFVVTQAENKDILAITALSELALKNPKELLCIKEYCAGELDKSVV